MTQATEIQTGILRLIRLKEVKRQQVCRRLQPIAG